MIVIPAVDLKDGKVVRLVKGDFDQLTTYGDNPLVVAKSFEDLGAKYIHIVDLDGALQGESKNIKSLSEVVNNIKVPVEFGGGIRKLKQVEELANLGVSRIILGTVAIEDFHVVREMAKEYKDLLAVSVDAVRGKAATHAWKNQTNIDVLEIAEKMEEVGIKTLIYTDIEKDGMLEGPNFNEYKRICKNCNLNIIASGGVTTYEDLERLEELNLYGAIVGKSIYEGKIDIELALRRFNS